MTKISELINLASAKTGLSKEEIRLRIRNKQRELSGLVSEEGAAYIVANELGVKTKNRVVESVLKLKELKPEMKSVNIMGRAKAIYGPREFTTKKGIRNKVANLEIIDNTDTCRVVLWNMHDIEKIEKGIIKVGMILQVKNGYVRESKFTDGLEVHVGNHGILIENPEDTKEEEFPAVSTGEISIKELKPEMPANVIARIKSKYEVKKFETNGRKGKVGNLIINDGTSSARLVLWNEQADLMDSLKVGDILKVNNAYTKEGLRGVEVQANYNTKIFVNPKGVEVPEWRSEKAERKKIASLNEGDFSEIKAAITTFFGNNFVYDMCPNCNKKATAGKCGKCGAIEPKKLLILNLSIDDGSGTIRAALFREVAENLLSMKTEEVAADPEKAKSRLKELQGSEKLFSGQVKYNVPFERLELNAYNVGDINTEKELELQLSDQ